MQHEWMSTWWFQNSVTLLLLIGMGALLWRLWRRADWRQAAREVWQRRLARLSALVLCGYALVALCDSVGWRSPLRHPETGALQRSETNGRILYDRGLSLLDRLLTPLRLRKEKTYSAPLATVQYQSETVLGADGRLERTHPPLRFPRQHLLGTDRIGVDVLYQSCKSIRTALILGVLTTLLALPFALLLGVAAGYYGGWLDDLIQYVYTVLNSIPSVLFIAAFMILFGRGLPQLCLAMGIASWTTLCRLLRGETLKLREAEFVTAARAMGASSAGIVFRHILPNVMHLVMITAVLRFSNEVLAEAALTYLGIGVGADTMSWGTMINDARAELTRDPVIWWKLAAALFSMLGLVLPANIFADSVRDALDPRLRR